MKPTTNPLLSQLRTLVEQNSRRWKAIIVLEAIGLAIAARMDMAG